MEKSIETLWKEGFIEQNNLIIPRLNDLYNQKSIHIIDKFKRTFKYNHIYIYILALVHLLLGMSMGAYIAGTSLCLMLFVLTIISRNSRKSFELINQSDSSYHYLKNFDNYLKQVIQSLGQFYQVFYPLYYTLLIIGFLETITGKRALEKIMNNPNTIMTAGFPVVWISVLLALLIIITIFAKAIFRFDLKTVYGGIMKRLNELLTDMEELRK